MTEAEQRVLIEEVEKVRIPENFAGGCRRSLIMPSYCMHMTANGQAKKIEENCPQSDTCVGYHYRYNIK